MGILPSLVPELQEQLNNINQTSTQEVKELGRCFLIEDNQFAVESGNLITIDNITAIKQWIKIVLCTEKDKYEIYKGTGYYCNIKDLIGNRPNSFIVSELQREISETLSKHRYIKSISDFKTSFEKDKLTATFTVNLIDNTSFEQEV